MSTQDRPSGRSFLATPAGIALCVFLAIAAFFLWVEHRAHVLGVLPWLLLAACPLCTCSCTGAGMAVIMARSRMENAR